MILGIDAFNISRGGGLTHLVEFLSEANPSKHGFDKVIIWGNLKVLNKIENKDWLQKENVPMLNKGLLYRIFWHQLIQAYTAKKNCCDIVFAPGGVALSGFSPIVTMSRNMLPFEWKELKRFGFSMLTFKLIILHFTQLRSFKKANGLIFLTRYAKEIISKHNSIKKTQLKIIHHGVNPIFLNLVNIIKIKILTGLTPVKFYMSQTLHLTNINGT